MTTKKMATKKEELQSIEELLKKLLITQLSIAGVGQKEIAKIVGISLGSVNSIAKYVKINKTPKNG